MAKPLILKFGASEIPFSLNKVERSDLYGTVEIETLDENGGKCHTATLADDGCNLIQSGGISLANRSSSPGRASRSMRSSQGSNASMPRTPS